MDKISEIKLALLISFYVEILFQWQALQPTVKTDFRRTYSYSMNLCGIKWKHKHVIYPHSSSIL